jgi:hypothetical protein
VEATRSVFLCSPTARPDLPEIISSLPLLRSRFAGQRLAGFIQKRYSALIDALHG